MLVKFYIKWCRRGECVPFGSEGPQPIHGSWSEFSSWTKCSRTCGIGVKQKQRKCNNPTPRFGGRQCEGDDIFYELCNTIVRGFQYNSRSYWLNRREYNVNFRNARHLTLTIGPNNVQNLTPSLIDINISIGFHLPGNSGETVSIGLHIRACGMLKHTYWATSKPRPTR